MYGSGVSYSAERWCVQYIQPTIYLNGKKCMQNMARCWLVGEKENVISALQEPNTGFSWEAVILFSQISGFLM